MLHKQLQCMGLSAPNRYEDQLLRLVCLVSDDRLFLSSVGCCSMWPPALQRQSLPLPLHPHFLPSEVASLQRPELWSLCLSPVPPDVLTFLFEAPGSASSPELPLLESDSESEFDLCCFWLSCTSFKEMSPRERRAAINKSPSAGASAGCWPHRPACHANCSLSTWLISAAAVLAFWRSAWSRRSALRPVSSQTAFPLAPHNHVFHALSSLLAFLCSLLVFTMPALVVWAGRQELLDAKATEWSVLE